MSYGVTPGRSARSAATFEPFRVDVVPHRDEVQVRPVGELDLATVPSVDAQLAELCSAGFTRLVLDLRDVSFLDSTGIRMLVSWHGRCSADRMRFSIIPGPPAVGRALEIAGVAEILAGAPVAVEALPSGTPGSNG